MTLLPFAGVFVVIVAGGSFHINLGMDGGGARLASCGCQLGAGDPGLAHH